MMVRRGPSISYRDQLIGIVFCSRPLTAIPSRVGNLAKRVGHLAVSVAIEMSGLGSWFWRERGDRSGAACRVPSI